MRSNWKPVRRVLAGPDHVRLDTADDRQAHDHALAAAKRIAASGHEAVGGNVDDRQMHVAKPAMLSNHLVIHRMADRPAKIGYRKLCSCTHGCLEF